MSASSPNWQPGYVATAAEWNALWASKQDVGGVLSVKDFGAKGNGTTDDTAALNAAMTAAASANKSCYMPAGIYRTTGLTYPSGLQSLFGDGRGITIIKRIDNAIAGQYMFSPTNIGGVSIRGLTIDCNAANNTQISAGIVATGCWLLRLYDMAIINTTAVSGVYGWGVNFSNGIDGTHGTSSSFSDCEFSGVQEGILVGGTSKNVIVTGCSFYGTIRNAVSMGAEGANANDCTGCEVSNCTVVGPGGGIAIGSLRPGFLLDSCRYCSILNNIVSGTDSYGIAVQAESCNVSGNTVSNCCLLFSAGAGVIIGPSYKCNFTANTIANCQGGLEAGGARNCVISGNNIADSWGTVGVGSGYGMNLGAAHDNIIIGNVFNNNTGRAGNDDGVEIHMITYDGGGEYPYFPFLGANNTITNNTFNMGSVNGHGISCSDLPEGTVVTNNIFTGGTEDLLLYVATKPAVVVGNIRTSAMQGASVAAASLVVWPDVFDIILLSGASTSINQIMTRTQQLVHGKLTHADITNGGSYTTPPTLTITGAGGSGAVANALLNGPAPAAVGGIQITNGGTGVYTSITITPSSGALTAVAYIGAGNATLGREITIINTSGSYQTLVNGTWLQLSGDANLLLRPGASVKLRGTGSDVSGYPIFTELVARDFSSPPAIGGSNPNSGAFSTLIVGSGAGGPFVRINGGTSGANVGPVVDLQWAGITRGGVGGYSAVAGGAYDSRVAVSGYDGIAFLTVGTLAGGFDTSFNFSAVGSVGVGGTTGPTWTTGSAAPSATAPIGSFYSRTGGSVGATLYISRGGGTWAAVAGV